ncbi:hypothetical protein [Thiocapsa sp. UBA6158]|jgi:hypothetical protein|uniref:hypothetical protein n=1 Tax=Thiocapsa sp. UBA6158 TaxID=1947692 RepID=UPI0025D65383|nr:hypothetical protein [Thiocapsa sp. UBA6158]
MKKTRLALALVLAAGTTGTISAGDVTINFGERNAYNSDWEFTQAAGACAAYYVYMQGEMPENVKAAIKTYVPTHFMDDYKSFAVAELERIKKFEGRPFGSVVLAENKAKCDSFTMADRFNLD